VIVPQGRVKDGLKLTNGFEPIAHKEVRECNAGNYTEAGV
jgi:hypothetical protein